MLFMLRKLKNELNLAWYYTDNGKNTSQVDVYILLSFTGKYSWMHNLTRAHEITYTEKNCWLTENPRFFVRKSTLHIKFYLQYT